MSRLRLYQHTLLWILILILAGILAVRMFFKASFDWPGPQEIEMLQPAGHREFQKN